jgi:hypothetical protein
MAVHHIAACQDTEVGKCIFRISSHGRLSAIRLSIAEHSLEVVEHALLQRCTQTKLGSIERRVCGSSDNDNNQAFTKPKSFEKMLAMSSKAVNACHDQNPLQKRQMQTDCWTLSVPAVRRRSKAWIAASRALIKPAIS